LDRLLSVGYSDLSMLGRLGSALNALRPRTIAHLQKSVADIKTQAAEQREAARRFREETAAAQRAILETLNKVGADVGALAAQHRQEIEANARLLASIQKELAALDLREAQVRAVAQADLQLAGDLPALELIAEKVGAGEPPEGISDDDRLAHLARRIDQLSRVAAREGLRLSEGALSMVARAAEGGMRDALSMLDQVRAACGDAPGDEEVAGALGAVDAASVARIALRIHRSPKARIGGSGVKPSDLKRCTRPPSWSTQISRSARMALISAVKSVSAARSRQFRANRINPPAIGCAMRRRSSAFSAQPAMSSTTGACAALVMASAPFSLLPWIGARHAAAIARRRQTRTPDRPRR